MKKIELEKLTIELISSNILLISLKDSVVIEEADVIEVKKHNLELTQGKDYVIVFDSGNYTTISEEGRKLMSSPEIELNRKASAFVINSLGQKLIANFYLKVDRPKVPTKFFSDKEKAMNWVKEILASS